MRIAHVVTYVSADNAFGGPVSVARAQTEELARRGHDVTLFAGWDGEARCDTPGVDVRLRRLRRILPAPGFSGLFSGPLWRELHRAAPQFDAVHVHLARDLVTLSAVRAVVGRGPTLVTQTHGMVMPDSRPIARVIDALATRRALAAARSTAVLTDVEHAGLESVARRSLPIIKLPNGIALKPYRGPSSPGRRPTVVFCARLHPRKRVLAFAEMAKIVCDSGRDARFMIAGPDEGDRDSLLRYVADHQLSDRVHYVGALAPDAVRAFLADADVFVLPSEREPFPMTLLEAMAEGTPSVITTGCMIAAQLDGAGGPIVTGPSPAELSAAVMGLLDETPRAETIGHRSRELIRERYGISAVVDRLEQIYGR